MYHIIFEGAELSGKSWLMSQVYNRIEPEERNQKYILDGCHWFNADNGVFGTEESEAVIKGYVEIFKALKNKNVIVEKFTLSDQIYQKLHRNKDVDYDNINESLNDLGYKIILITFKEDKNLIEKRIKDRLNLYPHYEAIVRTSDWYINQQRIYKELIKECGLPFLEIETNILPDKDKITKIIEWI